MSEPLRACVLPGTVYKKRGDKFFRSSIDKKHCGTVGRITSIGNAQLYQDLVEIKVGGGSVFAPVQNVRMGAERYRDGERRFQARARTRR